MKRERSKGILFSAPMIRALLNTSPDVWPAKPIDPLLPWKWQSRRLVKPNVNLLVEMNMRCAPFRVGSILYAKETWKPHCEGPISDECPFGTCIKYKADGAMIKPTDWTEEQGFRIEAQENTTQWKPSIFMPRFAARLWFEVMRVRVERVNAITDDDARAEGAACAGCYSGEHEPCSYVTAYLKLWDSINGAGSFVKGPWVWVYDLRRISKP